MNKFSYDIEYFLYDGINFSITTSVNEVVTAFTDAKNKTFKKMTQGWSMKMNIHIDMIYLRVDDRQKVLA